MADIHHRPWGGGLTQAVLLALLPARASSGAEWEFDGL